MAYGMQYSNKSLMAVHYGAIRTWLHHIFHILLLPKTMHKFQPAPNFHPTHQILGQFSSHSIVIIALNFSTRWQYQIDFVLAAYVLNAWSHGVNGISHEQQQQQQPEHLPA